MEQPILARNLSQLEERIAQACQRAGRARSEVTLVAVSKTRTPEEVATAYRCGLADMGENRIEELEDKRPAVEALLPGANLRWHMVGHIQSRKAARVAALAHLVHSVDSVRLACRLDRHADAEGRRLPVLLEVNVSREPTKYGFPAWDRATREALAGELAPLAGLGNLDVRGLMTVAPLGASPGELHAIFGGLRALAEFLEARLAFGRWTELSMGMTDDLEIAIEEGATMIRVGRAIFGPREA